MTRQPKSRRELFSCPNCGADVRVGAKVCRECGSDASTGWQDQDDIDHASVDLPDGYRDVDDPGGNELPATATPTWVRWTALLVVLAMVGAVVIAMVLRTR